MRPSVIHAHDWQAALAPVYARTALRDDPVDRRRAHRAHDPQPRVPGTVRSGGAELDRPRAAISTRRRSLEFWGRASTLKGGVVFSDKITTVSPTYAHEILTPEYGFGFDGVLADRAADLVGILNGIDTETWNPRTDRHLPAHFDARSLERKADVKRALLESAGLPRDEAAMARPLIGIVTRLTHQKGCDLVAAAAERLMALDASVGDARQRRRWCEDMWRQLAARLPERVGRADRLRRAPRAPHRGGRRHVPDAVVVRAVRAEPDVQPALRRRCPIVRATGGLEDTVVDADESPDAAPASSSATTQPNALVGAVERALEAFRNPDRWRQIQQNGMKPDFSWDVSAREYVKVYRGD